MQNNIISWDDQVIFTYNCTDLNRLHQLYCVIEVFSEKNNKSGETPFLGDCEVDLYSLFVGPPTHRIALSHTVIEAELRFELTSIQQSFCTITMDNICITNIPEEEKKIIISCEIPNSKKKISKQFVNSNSTKSPWSIINESLPPLADYFSYTDLFSDDNGLTIAIKEPGTLFTQKTIGECTIHFDPPTIKCTSSEAAVTDISIPGSDLKLSASISISDFPTYLQCKRGEHVFTRFENHYNDIEYYPCGKTIEEKPLLQFSEKVPLCIPSFSPTMSKYPLTFALTISQVKVILSRQIPQNDLELTAKITKYPTVTTTFQHLNYTTTNNTQTMASSLKSSKSLVIQTTLPTQQPIPPPPTSPLDTSLILTPPPGIKTNDNSNITNKRRSPNRHSTIISSLNTSNITLDTPTNPNTSVSIIGDNTYSFNNPMKQQQQNQPLTPIKHNTTSIEGSTVEPTPKVEDSSHIYSFNDVKLPEINTQSVYYLNHRYLIFSISNKNQKGDLYCEEYISLHNIFSGATKYHLMLYNRYNLTEKIIVELQIHSDTSRTVSLFFNNIELTNLPEMNDLFLEYIFILIYFV